MDILVIRNVPAHKCMAPLEKHENWNSYSRPCIGEENIYSLVLQYSISFFFFGWYLRVLISEVLVLFILPRISHT